MIPIEPGGPPSTPPRPRTQRRMSRVHFSEDDSYDYDLEQAQTASPPPPRTAHSAGRPGPRPVQSSHRDQRRSSDEGMYRSDPNSAGSLSIRISEDGDSPDPRRPSRLETRPISTDPNAHIEGGSRIQSRRPYANPSPMLHDQASFDSCPTASGPQRPSGNRGVVPLKSALVNSPNRASVDEHRGSREDDMPARPGRAYHPAVSPNLPAYSPRRRSESVSFSEKRPSFDEKYPDSEEEDDKWERERLYASPRQPRGNFAGPRGSVAPEYGYPGTYLASISGKQLGASSSAARPIRRRTTLDLEDGFGDERDIDAHDAINGNGDSSFRVQGGVFSQLLKLAGAKQKRKKSYAASIASTTGTTGSGFIPTMRSLGLKRSDSITSQAFEELDSEDPRVTGVKRKKAARRHSMSELPFIRMMDLGGGKGKDRKRCASIQLHVADILTRQAFILKLAKALMMFGAPSHRIESQLIATALVLEIDAQFVHFPSIVVASFGDPDTRTSETHFIKAVGGDLDLGKLHQVHLIYKGVVHDELDAADGTRQIHALLHSEREYKLWHRMIMAFLSCGLIAPMGFGGSFIDGLAAGTLGTMLSFMQLHVATRSSMYSNVFEISIATIISFAARGLSVSGYFCYGAVASAGVCLILPGYTILCGALELASKNIVAGSVRMVYAIIYSLFLASGFGITIGSDLFYVVDPPARRAAEALFDYATFTTVTGSFTSFPFADALDDAGMGQLGWNGTFTFSNATTDQILTAYQAGSITCPREPDWPWWRQSMPAIYLLGFVPIYSALSALWSFQPLRSTELPVMVFISSAGFFANSLANKFIFDRSDVVSAIGAFVIGILGNIYSRVFGGTAFTSMVPGVLFLVPSGISAAGGLAMTSANDSHEDSYSQGLIIGFRMVEVAIGITVGLFGSGFLIYSVGRKKNAALFAF